MAVACSFMLYIQIFGIILYNFNMLGTFTGIQDTQQLTSNFNFTLKNYTSPKCPLSSNYQYDDSYSFPILVYIHGLNCSEIDMQILEFGGDDERFSMNCNNSTNFEGINFQTNKTQSDQIYERINQTSMDTSQRIKFFFNFDIKHFGPTKNFSMGFLWSNYVYQNTHGECAWSEITSNWVNLNTE